MVEVLLASALFVLLVTALAGGYLYGEESSAVAGNRARAVFLAEEGLEAVRNMKDAGFGDLSAGAHGLATTSNQWSFSGTEDVSGIFTRSIAISTLDTARKVATATVTWQQTASRTGTVTLVTRFTNWLRSVSSWATPTQEATMDLSGIEDGLKIQVQGDYAYVVRNDGAPDFLVIDVSNPASPSLVGSLNLTGTSTNIAVAGNFAYISNKHDSQELQVIDITTPSSPSVAGTFNAPGTADALGVYAVGTTAYLVRASSADNEFIIVNATVPASPVSIGSLNLGATGYEVYVSGNSAFVASGSNSAELQVVNITVPAAPALLGTGYNAGGNTDAVSIAGSGTNVFLAQGSNIHIISVSAPAAPTLLGTFAGAGTVNDIALNLGNSGTYVYFVSASSNREFELFDISAPASPVSVGSINLTAYTGIAYDAVLDRAFVVGADDASEFLVIKPL